MTMFDEHSARRGGPFPRLPIRPRPFMGESSRGYLLRIAHANGHDTARNLWKALRWWDYPADRLLRMGLKLPRVAVEALGGPFPAYCQISRDLPGSLRVDDFNQVEFRWCPSCLAESEFVRMEWEIKLFCVCVVHKVILTDRCPACDSLQPLARGALGRCRCGTHLSVAPSVPASPELIAFHDSLLTVLAGWPVAGGLDLAPLQWLRLVKYFGSFGLEAPPTRPGQVPGLHKLQTSLRLTTATAHLLSDWPRNYHQLLDDIARSMPGAARLGHTYGRLYRAIYRDLAEPGFQFLRDGFEAYLHKNWPGLLARRNRRLGHGTITTHPRKTLRDMARQIKTGKSSIKRLATAGVIDGAAIRHPSGRTTWAFPVTAVRQAEERLADTVNFKQARRILGVSKRRVRELIDAGLVRAWITPKNARAAAWSISRKDAYTLASAGKRPPGSDVNGHRRFVALRQVLKFWQLKTGEFPGIVRAIQSGVLACARDSNTMAGLGGALFDAAEIRGWIHASRSTSEELLSIDKAAARLGFKQQVAYELVRSGLLHSVVSVDGRQRGRRVTLQAIDEFRCRYVALTDLAQSRGVGVRRMLGDLSARPISGPRINGARQYFYRRSDIENSEDQT
jgi:TniQ